MLSLKAIGDKFKEIFSEGILKVDSTGSNIAGRKKLIKLTLDSSTAVAAGAYDTITVQPPEGKIWRIVNGRIYVPAPPSATTGSHVMYINQHLLVGTTDFISVTSAYTDIIDIRMYPDHGTGSPSDFASFIMLLHNAKFNNAVPLYLNYFNSTDVSQTNTRYIRLLIEEEDEAQ